VLGDIEEEVKARTRPANRRLLGPLCGHSAVHQGSEIASLICNSIKSSIKSAPLIYVFYVFVRPARSILSNALNLRCSAIAALARSP